VFENGAEVDIEVDMTELDVEDVIDVSVLGESVVEDSVCMWCL